MKRGHRIVSQRRVQPYEVRRSLRCTQRPIDQYKALLRLDWDWSSTGIWYIEEPGARHLSGNASYADLKLSQRLVDHFTFWTNWHELSHAWDRHRQADWELIGLYAWALAVDLKRELGNDYYVEYGRREIHDDITYMMREFFGITEDLSLDASRALFSAFSKTGTGDTPCDDPRRPDCGGASKPSNAPNS